MSKLAHLKEHIHALEDINNIMKAMKNLALHQINQMVKYQSTHEKSIKTIKDAGSDFFSFYPSYLNTSETTKFTIGILIGSERGFCGNFNDTLIHQLNDFEKNHIDINLKLIIIGRKLAMKMAGDKRVIREISGYETAEEMSSVILNLIQVLEDVSLEINIKPDPIFWRFFFNESENYRVQTTTLQPFVEFPIKDNLPFSFEPILNLTKEKFLFEFIDTYLFSILYFIFYRSFMAENYQRLHHLDNALDMLEKNKHQLAQKLNLIRQEEITEEIEIIMLSVDAIADEIQTRAISDSGGIA